MNLKENLNKQIIFTKKYGEGDNCIDFIVKNDWNDYFGKIDFDKLHFGDILYLNTIPFAKMEGENHTEIYFTLL